MTPEQRHDRLRTWQTAAIFLGILSLALAAAALVDAWDERREYEVAVQRTPQTLALDRSLRGPVPMLATWYGKQYHGRKTASGARFNRHALTAAHRTLPFGAVLEVEHEGQAVRVTVTDRGPEAWTGRDLDLSEAAFRALAPVSVGVIAVNVRRVP